MGQIVILWLGQARADSIGPIPFTLAPDMLICITGWVAYDMQWVVYGGI